MRPFAQTCLAASFVATAPLLLTGCFDYGHVHSFRVDKVPDQRRETRPLTVDYTERIEITSDLPGVVVFRDGKPIGEPPLILEIDFARYSGVQFGTTPTQRRVLVKETHAESKTTRYVGQMKFESTTRTHVRDTQVADLGDRRVAPSIWTVGTRIPTGERFVLLEFRADEVDTIVVIDPGSADEVFREAIHATGALQRDSTGPIAAAGVRRLHLTQAGEIIDPASPPPPTFDPGEIRSPLVEATLETRPRRPTMTPPHADAPAGH
jgi:hypothetical protein